MEPRTITSAEERPDGTMHRQGWQTWNHAGGHSTRLAALFCARRQPYQRARALATLRSFISVRAATQGARVRESAALGDRRFISIIQFERQRFLIGSSPARSPFWHAAGRIRPAQNPEKPADALTAQFDRSPPIAFGLLVATAARSGRTGGGPTCRCRVLAWRVRPGSSAPWNIVYCSRCYVDSGHRFCR